MDNELNDLTELKLVPNKSGYSVSSPSGVISVSLDGGRPFQRLDIIGSWRTVECTWYLNDDDFEYINAFFIGIAQYGANRFKVQLSLESPSHTMHEAIFSPSSMRYSFQDGCYSVSAQLNVRPHKPTGYEADYVYIRNEFGADWREIADYLDIYVNKEIPRAMHGNE